MKKVVLSLCLALAMAGSVSSADWTSFGGGIRPGDILVNGGFVLGTFYPDMPFTETSLLAGGSASVDFALPVKALTVGGELSFSGSAVKATQGSADISLGMIPVMARVGYHPDLFGIDRLDTYAVAKIGLGLGFWMGSNVPDVITSPVGAAFGLDIGMRYFFADSVGAFFEGGYEYYILSYAVDYGVGKKIMSAYASKFLTLGIVFRLQTGVKP